MEYHYLPCGDAGHLARARTAIGSQVEVLLPNDGQTMIGEAEIPAATRILYGPGRVEATLSDEVGLHGGAKAFLVTGRSLGGSDLAKALKSALGGRLCGHYAQMGEHSPRSSVLEAARNARDAGADTLVALGGGSTIVGTKCMAVVMGEGEDLDSLRANFDYRTGKITAPKLIAPKPPVIAIPTTLTSGEFSSAMGVTNETTGSKDIFIAPSAVPRTVILDPVATTMTPDRLWASTGVKALQNAIERFYARNANPFIEGTCLEAIAMVFRDLRHSLQEPSDLAARGRLQFLNLMTAFGAGKGGIGLGHGICHQLGGVCGISHGISGCIVLPYMMAFNRPATLARQVRIAQAMGLSTEGRQEEKVAYEAEMKVRQLVAELGLPGRLRDAKVRYEDLDRVAELTLHDRTLAPTPRPPRDAAEVRELLE